MQELNKAPKPKADIELNLSTATSRLSKKWKNRPMAWSQLLARLSQPTVTQETVAEYQKMTKAEQVEVKDVGGFIGGFLKGGRRVADAVQSRSMVTLDVDFPKGDLWDAVSLVMSNAAALYSTHKYTSKSKRVRLLIPLKRPVTPEEYQPLARKIAEQFGMDLFDDTTYEPERLMFWPSHPRDGEYEFHFQDGPWLDPEVWLAKYEDWKDSSYWPESSRSEGIRKREAKRAGDPLQKPGLIGTFNRTYTIEAAIDKFLADVYEPMKHGDRYTYVDGTTFGGLVLYDDKFAYSHHSTDPVGDRLTNAWDLVRIHKFGDLDVDSTVKNINSLPSSVAMREFAMEDTDVKLAWQEDVTGLQRSEIEEDFGDDFLDDGEARKSENSDWLTVNKAGLPEVNTFLLAQAVLEETPMRYNEMEFLRYDKKTGVWRDDAEVWLKTRLTNHYLKNLTKINLIRETVAAVQGIVGTTGELPEPDVNKIVLKNGVYDIKNNSFKKNFCKDNNSRMSHPVKYDPAATAPTFQGFVEFLVGKETAPFIYEWFGYNFYQGYPIQSMLFLYGPGGTGKSTLINLMQAVLGKEAYSAVTLEALMTKNFAAKNLYRKTANFDSDAKPQYLADGSVLKILTGEDMVYADVKYGEALNFYNYAKLTFAMNRMPAMRDFSGGLKRRAIVLKLTRRITKEVKRQFPRSRMMKELPGIFNLAMNGLRRLLKDGPTVTEQMRGGLDEWMKANDQVGRFVDETVEHGKNKSIAAEDLYLAYTDYASDSGEKPLGKYKMFERMEELGFVRKRSQVDGVRKWYWQGIGLVQDGDFD